MSSERGNRGSVTLSTDEISVTVLATRGGRITSVRNVSDGREWLSQSHDAMLGDEREPAATFTETDHCGWDEMFPSVDSCVFPTDPFLGVAVPDHGELWSSSWEVLEETDTSVRQSVRSGRFGYTFERTLCVEGSSLRCDYRCRVDADVEVALPLLWNLHPQFRTVEGTHLELPGQRSTVLDTSAPGDVRVVAWAGDLVVQRDVDPGSDRMIYLQPDDLVDHATLVDPTGSRLQVSWDRSFAPYLGIWLDNDRYTGETVMAIEPTNGFFDELERAWKNKLVSFFSPGEEVTWWVEVTLGEGVR